MLARLCCSLFEVERHLDLLLVEEQSLRGSGVDQALVVLLALLLCYQLQETAGYQNKEIRWFMRSLSMQYHRISGLLHLHSRSVCQRSATLYSHRRHLLVRASFAAGPFDAGLPVQLRALQSIARRYQAIRYQACIAKSDR